MKVTLTLAEITGLLIGRFGLPNDATVEIAGMVPAPASEPESVKYKGYYEVKLILAAMVDPFTGQNLLRNVGCFNQTTDASAINFGAVPSEKKIATIKALRTVIPGLGLADAKHAVEDWTVFMTYVLRNGIPDIKNFYWR